jgi:hypothetical protein
MFASPSDVPSQIEAIELHPEFGYFAPTMRFRRKVALTLKGVALGALAGAVAMFFMTMEREEQALTMLATPVLIAPAPSKPAQAALPTRMAAVDIVAPSVRFVPESIALPAVAPTSPPVRGIASTAVSVAPVRFVPESIALPAAVPTSPPVRGIASTVVNVAPVRFVPESTALPAVVPTSPPLRGTISTAVAEAASVPAPSAPSTVGAPPAASAFAAAPGLAPSTAGTSPAASVVAAAPAPAAEAVAKPKKKIVRKPQPERTARSYQPEHEPRAAYGSPFRPLGPPIFGFGR